MSWPTALALFYFSAAVPIAWGYATALAAEIPVDIWPTTGWQFQDLE